MSIARIVAELVARGEEDLAEELLSVSKLDMGQESHLDRELNKAFATLRANVRKAINQMGTKQSKVAIGFMDREVDVFQNKLYNLLTDVLGK
jgi:hypothetical protein